MPVPDSGELELRGDINNEVEGNTTDNDVSLKTLSDDAGFDSAPYAMSEFYDYTAFTAPTISAQVTTSSVSDTSITMAFTYANSQGASVESGFYFGTSSTMGNNTFYSSGSASNTSLTRTRTIGSLSASTTYYIWGIVKDTEDPARFTQIATNSKSQATGAALSYSYNQSSGTQGYVDAYRGGTASSSCHYSSQYDHTYHSWTTQNSASSSATCGAGTCKVWFSGRETYRSGVTTSNRVNTSWSTNTGGGGSGFETWLVMPTARSATLSASSTGPKTHPDTNTIGTGTHNLPTNYQDQAREATHHAYCCLGGSYSHVRTFSV